jgi:DNA polymerase-3 subunit delta'
MPFRDIAGHRLTLRLLARAVARRSLPPSLLFTGGRGVGKRRTAVALAQALNCLEPRTDVALEGGPGPKETTLALDACGTCTACSRIARGIHPDVITLGPDPEAGNIKVDVVRELIDRSGYRPFEGRWRLVIIDDADTLLDSAQNALLKTLEEPPSTSVFVLVTAQPDMLLATVRSRCPQVRFAPLSAAEIAAHLQVVHGLAAPAAHATAAASDGSIGRALESGTEAATAIRDGARRLLEGVARSGVRGRFAAAQMIVGKTPKGFGAGERESVATHLRVLQTMIRDIGVLSTSGEGCALANADLTDVLEGLRPAFDHARLVHAFTAVHQAIDALGPPRNGSPKIVADWVALQV